MVAPPLALADTACSGGGGMRIQALAVDYDGTIAHHGTVSPDTLDALVALRRSGRRLVLVTGRILEDLEKVAPELTTFDLIVAENGAVLCDPRRREVTTLADPPPAAFLKELDRRAVPYGRGRVIVATAVPHDAAMLEAIRDLGIKWQLSYNKGSVMALPAGVTKAAGLTSALSRMGISRHNVVGAG